jgi:hypothetical protein
MKQHVIKAYGQACIMLISCLTYPSTLTMEVIFSSEMSVDFHSTKESYIFQKTELLTTTYVLTYLLMYGAEPFLRSCQLCSHSEIFQQF